MYIALARIFKHPLSLGISVTLLTLFMVVSNTFKLSDYGRNTALDAMTKLYPYEQRYPDNAQRLVFVDIDDKALAEVGQWPWPRQTTAKLVSQIASAGASAIGVDILFAERDRFSPDSLSQMLGLPKALILSAGGVSGDAKLAEVLQSTPTALAFALSQDVNLTAQQTIASHFISLGDIPTEVLSTPSLLLPIGELAKVDSAGFVNTYKAAGIVRETPLLAVFKGQLLPALNLAILRVHQRVDHFIIKQSRLGNGLLIRVGDKSVEVSQGGTLLFHHGHSSRFQRISAAAFFNGPPQDLHGKIVIVGSGAVGLGDRHSTPLEDDIAGPLFHLQVIDQILAGRFITHHIAFDLMIFVLSATLAILFCYLITRIALGYVLIIVPFIGAGLMAGALYGFIHSGFLFNVPIALLLLLCGPVSTYLMKSLLEANLRKKIQTSFAQYVPEDIVKRISQASQMPSLGGEEIECSILFLDIRGYTTMTEALRHEPKLLVQAIGLIMNAVTERLIAEGATIDKYIGDAVMAFWNAPERQADHQLRALRAALHVTAAKARIQQAVSELSPALKDIQIDFGIGIATGPAIVGNMGSDFRFNYTVMGDTVNVAARLESLTKEKHQHILATGGLLDAQHATLMQQQMVITHLGKTTVKGKLESIEVFAIAPT